MPFSRWEVCLLVAGAALLMVLFTYVRCRTHFQMQDSLPRWAKRQGFRIIHSEARTFFQGPFWSNKYSLVYYVTVEDEQKRRKKGWVRLGWWYIVGFREKTDVRWED